MFRVLSAIVLLYLSPALADECDACLEDLCYEKIKIWEGPHIIGPIDIDRTSNTLYANFENEKDKYTTAGINVDTKEMEVVPNIEYTSAKTVDQKTRKLYMSASPRGIYVYDPTTKTTELYDEHLKNESIWRLQFKDKLYYSGFLFKKFCMFENGVSTCGPKLADKELNIEDFAIDKKGDLYFSSHQKLYKANASTEDWKLFADDFYKPATDKDGNLYLTHYSRIHKLDYENNKIVFLGIITEGQIFSLVFDKDNNMVYHDIDDTPEFLFKLKPTKKSCKVTTKEEDGETIYEVQITK